MTNARAANIQQKTLEAETDPQQLALEQVIAANQAALDAANVLQDPFAMSMAQSKLDASIQMLEDYMATKAV